MPVHLDACEAWQRLADATGPTGLRVRLDVRKIPLSADPVFRGHVDPGMGFQIRRLDPMNGGNSFAPVMSGIIRSDRATVILVGRVDLPAGVRAVFVIQALISLLLATVFLLVAVVSHQWLPLLGLMGVFVSSWWFLRIGCSGYREDVGRLVLDVEKVAGGRP